MPGLLRFPSALTSRRCHAKRPHASAQGEPAVTQRELEGSPWGSVSCWDPLHPPCTQSLPYIPPPLCTGPCTPFAPEMPPQCPSEHTTHPSHSALHPPSTSCTPCAASVPQGSVPDRGDTGHPTVGHSRPHSSAWRKEDAAPEGDGVRSSGCHMPAGRRYRCPRGAGGRQGAAASPSQPRHGRCTPGGSCSALLTRHWL